MLNHGINIIENEENIASVSESSSGISVVFGTAPIHLVDNPGDAVNKIVVCKNISEAKTKLGYCEEFDKYTLCQVMKTCFLDHAVGPIAFVNVLDSEKHIKTFTDNVVNVSGSQAVLALKGVLMDSLIVSGTSGALTLGTDYILSRENENIIITLLVGEVPSTVTVSGKQLDASMVQELDVIGGYDESSGEESGLELIRQVYPSTGLIPGIIAAPGFSHKKTVGAVMEVKCKNINGCFSAECILDIDTENCRKINQLKKAKSDAGFASKSSYLIWPMAKVDGFIVYGSACVLAATMASDVNNGGIPNASPSNKSVKIDAAVLSDGTEVLLDFAQADEVNKLGIGTFLNISGWKVWGNYTAAFPEKTAMNVKFWCVRRFFSWHGNNFIANNLAKIDQVANKKLIEQICDEENLKCNGYVATGVCASASIEFTEEDNTAENLQQGKLVFRQKLGVFGPAQQIVNNLTFDAESVRTSLAA